MAAATPLSLPCNRSKDPLKRKPFSHPRNIQTDQQTYAIAVNGTGTANAAFVSYPFVFAEYHRFSLCVYMHVQSTVYTLTLNIEFTSTPHAFTPVNHTCAKFSRLFNSWIHMWWTNEHTFSWLTGLLSTRLLRGEEGAAWRVLTCGSKCVYHHSILDTHPLSSFMWRNPPDYSYSSNSSSWSSPTS